MTTMKTFYWRYRNAGMPHKQAMFFARAVTGIDRRRKNGRR